MRTKNNAQIDSWVTDKKRLYISPWPQKVPKNSLLYSALLPPFSIQYLQLPTHILLFHSSRSCVQIKGCSLCLKFYRLSSGSLSSFYPGLARAGTTSGNLEISVDSSRLPGHLEPSYSHTSHTDWHYLRLNILIYVRTWWPRNYSKQRLGRIYS